MNIKPIVISLSLLLISASALADDDCDDPVADWQPQENLRQQLETEGWTVFRIKVDDGCYEVKGLDSDGHRIEAEYAPASLDLMEIEIKINRENGSSNDGYRHKIQRYNKTASKDSAPVTDAVKRRPSVTVE